MVGYSDKALGAITHGLESANCSNITNTFVEGKVPPVFPPHTFPDKIE